MVGVATTKIPAGSAQKVGLGFAVTAIFVAVVLLAASTLKIFQLSTEPVAGNGIFGLRWFQIAETQIELVFGLWLLTGLWKRWTWRLAVVGFLVFSGVTLYKGITGESSCGCFGRIAISPWYTLIFDLFVVLLLAVFRPGAAASQPARFAVWRCVAFVLITLGVGVPSLRAMVLYQPALLADDGSIVGGDKTILLEPYNWLGKKFPLQTYIQSSKNLRSGKWTVVLFHHDCPDCKNKLPRLIQDAEAATKSANVAKTVFIEMPPYASAEKSLVKQSGSYELAPLSDKRDWFAVTPVVLSLENGVVMKVREGDSPEQIATHISDTTAPLNSTPAKEPLMVIKDLGLVVPGSQHKVEFAVMNPAKTALPITRMRSECTSCVVPVAPKEIAANGTTSVMVDFHAPKDSVHYDKRVVLMTSNPEYPTIILRLQADVGLAVSTDHVDLGNIMQGQTRQFQLVLANKGDVPLHPIYAICDLDNIVVSVPKLTVPPKGRCSIPATFKTEGMNPGKGHVLVSVQTDCPTQNTVRIPVDFEISPAAN